MMTADAFSFKPNRKIKKPTKEHITQQETELNELRNECEKER